MNSSRWTSSCREDEVHLDAEVPRHGPRRGPGLGDHRPPPRRPVHDRVLITRRPPGHTLALTASTVEEEASRSEYSPVSLWYAAHPDGALSWRFQRARGGNGVLGDLASHAVDLVRYLLGEVDSVIADTAIFIPQRPVPTGATSGHGLATGGQLDQVGNEDYVFAQLRLASGARCTVEASRVSVGEQNAYGFEIHGTAGVVGWDFRRIGELRVGTGSVFQDQPVTTCYVGPGDGDYAAFQPGAAIAVGYDDLK